MARMADAAFAAASSPSTTADSAVAPPHSATVRITHWLTAVAVLALLVSGIEIVISHPRFYWGETGNMMTRPLFQLPIPSSRATVKTGYDYILGDQNGWSRYLHFQAAWLAVLTGAVYLAFGFVRGHFWRNLVPSRDDLSWAAMSKVIARHLRLRPTHSSTDPSYNGLQRLTYLGVIFVLFPLLIWTGLSMSPAFASAFPGAVSFWGGQQSARTLHFFATVLLLLFFVVHVAMVCISGFRSRMRAMTTGPLTKDKEGL